MSTVVGVTLLACCRGACLGALGCGVVPKWFLSELEIVSPSLVISRLEFIVLSSPDMVTSVVSCSLSMPDMSLFMSSVEFCLVVDAVGGVVTGGGAIVTLFACVGALGVD